MVLFRLISHPHTLPLRHHYALGAWIYSASAHRFLQVTFLNNLHQLAISFMGRFSDIGVLFHLLKSNAASLTVTIQRFGSPSLQIVARPLKTATRLVLHSVSRVAVRKVGITALKQESIMIIPVTPENSPFRITGPLNKPVHVSGSPSPTSTSTPGKTRPNWTRGSTVPPRPIARKPVTPTPPVFEPFQNALLKVAQSDAEAGEYWLALKNGKQPWPVVICNEEMIRKSFSDRPRPDNARRADGTWRKEFRPRGDLVGQKCYPAMYLGTWKL